MAQLFNQLPEADRKAGRGVYDALAFLMGEPDNLAVLEVADSLTAVHFYRHLGYGYKNGVTEPEDGLLYRLEKFR